MGGVATDRGIGPRTAAGGVDGEWLEQLSLPERVRLLEKVTASLSVLDRDGPGVPTGGELVAASVRIHRLVERLTGVRLRWVDQIEAEGLWAADRSFRSFAGYVAATHDMPRSEAVKQVRLARTLREVLPESAAALRAGTLTLAKARTLATIAASSDARVAALGEIAEIDESDAIGKSDEPDKSDDGGAGSDVEGADVGGAGAFGACEGQECSEGVPGCGSTGCPGGSGHVTVEGVLVRYAARLRSEDFTTVVRQFAAMADPDACDRGFREATEREYLSLARTLDGFHLTGFLTEASGQFLRARLNAIMGEGVPPDGRSHQQRMAHALTALARSNPGTGDPVRAQIGITMTLADLERLGLPLPGNGEMLPRKAGLGQMNPGRAAAGEGGAGKAAATGAAPSETLPGWRPIVGESPGSGRGDPEGARSEVQRWDEGRMTALAAPSRWFDGTGPVPDPVLLELLDNADIYRVVFGPDSTVLDLGRSSRLFPRRLRNAIINRDGGCVYPDCHLPAQYCEVHHVVDWQRGGRTSISNGAIMCGHHNRMLYLRQITMTRNNSGRHPPGPGRSAWLFWDRHGRQILPQALRSAG